MTQYRWIGSNGNFNDPNNWVDEDNETTPAGPPGAGDTALQVTTLNFNGQTVANLAGVNPLSTTFTGVLNVTNALSGATLGSGTFDVGSFIGVVTDGADVTATSSVSGTITGGTISAQTVGGTISGGDITAQILSGATVTGGTFSGLTTIKNSTLDTGAFNATTLAGGITNNGATITATNTTAANLNIVQSDGKLSIGTLTADSPYESEIADGTVNVGQVVLGGQYGGDFFVFGGGALTVTGSTTIGSNASIIVGVDPDDSSATGGTVTLGSLTINTQLAFGVHEKGKATINGNTVVNVPTLATHTDPDIGDIGTDDDTELVFNGNLTLGDSADGGFTTSGNPRTTINGNLVLGNKTGANGVAEFDSQVALTGKSVIIGNQGSGGLVVTGEFWSTGASMVVSANGGTGTVLLAGQPGSKAFFNSFADVSLGSQSGGGANAQFVANYASSHITDRFRLWSGSQLAVAGNTTFDIGSIPATGTQFREFERKPVVDIGEHGTVISSGTIQAAFVDVLAGGTLEAGGYSNGAPVGGTAVIAARLGGAYIAFSKVRLPNEQDFGDVFIDPNATLELEQSDMETSRTVAAPITFQGAGAGTLKLDDAPEFEAPILNAAGGDKIILSTITVSQWSLQAVSGKPNTYTLSINEQHGSIAYQISFLNADNTLSFAQNGADAVFTVTGAVRAFTSGSIVDPGLPGGTIFSDANGNGQQDSGEPTATVDANGGYDLNGAPDGAPLIVDDGTNGSTGLPFTGDLAAPGGSQIITPLTTLLVPIQKDTGASVAQAQSQVIPAFGFDSTLDLTNYNPMPQARQGNARASAVVVADAQILDTATMIQGLLQGKGVAQRAAFDSAIAAIAHAIENLPAGTTLDLTNATTVASLISSAATSDGVDVSEAKGSAAAIVAALNGELAEQEAADGANIVFDSDTMQRLVQESAAPKLQADANNSAQLAADVASFSGSNLTTALATAAAELTAAGISAPPLYYGSGVRDAFFSEGTSDILFRNQAGIAYLFEMDDSTVVSGTLLSTQVSTNWQIQGIGDFDGNGTADLLWVYNNPLNASDPLNGINYITLQNGPTATVGSGVVQQLSSDWKVAAVGAFDGAGIADILYRNSTTGLTYLDVMNGTTILSADTGFTSLQVTDPNWQISGVGDFDGDGAADILWRYDNATNAADPLNGAVYEWTMNGTSVASAGLISNQPGSDHWSIAGTGDFNGDGQADILFRYNNPSNASDPLNGFTYIDFMNGTNVLPTSAPTQWQVDNSWSIASIGDYNGDGMADILFQHAGDGATYIWDMNGTAVMSGNFTSMLSGPGWTVQNGVLTG